MKIAKLIERIHQSDNHEVLSPKGVPSVGITLPPDVEKFYQLTGGAHLFVQEGFDLDIVSPEGFVRANPVIALEDVEDDISHDWFIIARRGSSQFVTIDLHEARLGRCYDSFWDCHGMVGDMAIVAMSFESLLEQLLEKSTDAGWFWELPDFQSLGDAYLDSGDPRYEAE